MTAVPNSHFQTLSDYLNLTKPAIASLNVFVGVATLLLAADLSGATQFPSYSLQFQVFSPLQVPELSTAS
jgi:heme O synthase-like polyprenyltransferase